MGRSGKAFWYCSGGGEVHKKAGWDGGKGTWGGRVRVFGTVSMCMRVQEKAGGERRVLAGRFVEGTVG
nr:hypothetical protein [Tanacetum cinerariifolium]